MYDGYLEVNGIEVLNRERTEAYIRMLMPGVEVREPTVGLRRVLADETYSSPEADGAPWFLADIPESAGFLGVWPTAIEGAKDSTRGVPLTELMGDGVAHGKPRHAGKEMRVKATAFALTEEAMDVGLAWLKSILTEEDCEAVFGVGCTGRVFGLLAALPAVTRVTPDDLMRYFYSSEVIDGPEVTRQLPSRRGVLVELEFVISAGKPWAFRPVTPVSTLVLANGVSFSDPAGEDCSIAADPYSTFINDPYYTEISRPPKPPVMAPPNILAITSWRRLGARLPRSLSVQWGRTVPVVEVKTAADAVQQIRLRFYRDQGVPYEVARNVVPDPVGTDVLRWRAAADLVKVDDGIFARENASAGSLYIDPSKNIPAVPGDVWYISVEVRVTVPLAGVRIRALGYSTAAVTDTNEAVPQTPEDGFVRHEGWASVTAGDATAYLRAFVWPDGGSLPAGEGIVIRNMIVAKVPTVGVTEGFFSGSSPDTFDSEYSWTGAAGNSESTRSAYDVSGTTYGHLTGCGYDGEFLISYIPANCTLVLDGILREAYIVTANGSRSPATHLLYGSAGRPFMWPDLSCHSRYSMTADMMPAQTGVTVALSATVRE